MADHPWIDNPDGTISCPLCGLTRSLAFGRKPRGTCPKAREDSTLAQHAKPAKPCGGCNQKQPTQEQPLPSLVRRAVNFAGAELRDRMNARRRRSQAQVDRLHDGFCANCPHYNLLAAACAECGCPVNKHVSPDLDNKLAAAAEVCPKGLWPYPAIERRHLIYYLLPLAHSLKVWQWHVNQLRHYLPLFNGRKIVWIATAGEGNRLAIEPAELVRAAFGDDAAGIEFFERPNDPALWETVAFREMLAQIQSVDPHEATFYFHAKGVRRAKQDAIRPWCEAIYSHNLGRIDDAMESLRYWKCAGIARSPTTPGQGAIDLPCGWHFAGTGFWFRHDALFTKSNWSEIVEHSHAVEAYLGTKFDISESACLAYDNVRPVYDAATWAAAGKDDAAESAIEPADVRVSIIVAARNYGRYLRECLESCGWQTHKPHEIIYCDDASTDDSLAVASDLWTRGELRPFRVVGLSRQLGAVAARNHAASLATGNALLFVDGDDVLPADYLAKLVEKLSPATPFVYSDLQHFGRENRLVRMPAWGKADLRQQNFCNSSSLIWREAFEAVGGWHDGDFGHMPDWHLSLRLATLGEPRHADVALGYRRHGQSWTDQASADDQDRIRRQILASVDAWQKNRSGAPAALQQEK